MKAISCSLILLLLSIECFANQQAVKTVPAATSVGSILNVIFGLIVVLLVIYALAFVTKRFGALPGKSNHIIRVISGLNLSQRDKVVLVQVGEEQLLLGVSPGRINLLHNLTNPVEEDKKNSHPQESNFARKLTAVLRGDVKE